MDNIDERHISNIKFMRWLAIPLTFFGILLLSGAWGDYQIVREFDEKGVITQATITDRERQKNSALVSYQYEVDGQTYTTDDEELEDFRLYNALEKTTDIYYLPDNPSESLIVNNRLDYRDLFGGGLFMIGFMGITAQIFPIYNHRRSAFLARLTIHSRMILGICLVLGFVIGFLPIFSRPTGLWMNICLGIPVLLAVVTTTYFIVSLYGHHEKLDDTIEHNVVDISRKRKDMSMGKYRFPDNLMKMGFSRFGEFQRPEDRDDETITWLYRHSDVTIVAEITHVIESLQYVTWFDNGFRVQTGFPIGENIQDEHFIASFTETSMHAAYQQHIEITGRLQAAHGWSPVPINTLQAWKERDQHHMERDWRRIMRRTTNVVRLRVVFGVYLILFSVGFIYAYHQFSEHDLWQFMIGGTVLAYFFNILPGWLLNYRRSPIQFGVLESRSSKRGLQKSKEIVA